MRYKSRRDNGSIITGFVAGCIILMSGVRLFMDASQSWVFILAVVTLFAATFGGMLAGMAAYSVLDRRLQRQVKAMIQEGTK